MPPCDYVMFVSNVFLCYYIIDVHHFVFFFFFFFKLFFFIILTKKTINLIAALIMYI